MDGDDIMVSKNNRQHYAEQLAKRQPHYGLVKLSVGLVSTLLSTTLLYNNGHAATVDNQSTGGSIMPVTNQNASGMLTSTQVTNGQTNVQGNVAPTTNEQNTTNTRRGDAGGYLTAVNQTPLNTNANNGQSTSSVNSTAPSTTNASPALALAAASSATQALTIAPDNTNVNNTAALLTNLIVTNTSSSNSQSSTPDFNESSDVFKHDPTKEPDGVNQHVKESFETQNKDMRDPYLWYNYNQSFTPDGLTNNPKDYYQPVQGVPMFPVDESGAKLMSDDEYNRLMNARDTNPADTTQPGRYVQMNNGKPYMSSNIGSLDYISLGSGNLEIAGTSVPQGKRYHIVIIGKADPNDGHWTGEYFRVQIPTQYHSASNHWFAWFPIIGNRDFLNAKSIFVIDRWTDDPYGNNNPIDCWYGPNDNNGGQFLHLNLAARGFNDGISLDANTGEINCAGWLTDLAKQPFYKYTRFILHDLTTGDYIPMDVNNSKTMLGRNDERTDVAYRVPDMFLGSLSGYNVNFDITNFKNVSISDAFDIMAYYTNTWDSPDEYKQHENNPDWTYHATNAGVVRFNAHDHTTAKDGTWSGTIEFQIPVSYRDKTTGEKIAPDSVLQTWIRYVQAPSGEVSIRSDQNPTLVTTHDAKGTVNLDTELLSSAMPLVDFTTSAKQIAGYKLDPKDSRTNSSFGANKSFSGMSWLMFFTKTSDSQDNARTDEFEYEPYYINIPFGQVNPDTVAQYLDLPNFHPTYYYTKDDSIHGLTVKVIDNTLDGRLLDTYHYAGKTGKSADLSNIKVADYLELAPGQSFTTVPTTYAFSDQDQTIELHFVHKLTKADAKDYKSVNANIGVTMNVNVNRADQTSETLDSTGNIVLSADPMVDPQIKAVTGYQLSNTNYTSTKDLAKSLDPLKADHSYYVKSATISFKPNYQQIDANNKTPLTYQTKDFTVDIKHKQVNKAELAALADAIQNHTLLNWLKQYQPNFLNGDLVAALDPTVSSNNTNYQVNPQLSITLNYQQQPLHLHRTQAFDTVYHFKYGSTSDKVQPKDQAYLVDNNVAGQTFHDDLVLKGQIEYDADYDADTDTTKFTNFKVTYDPETSAKIPGFDYGNQNDGTDQLTFNRIWSRVTPREFLANPLKYAVATCVRASDAAQKEIMGTSATEYRSNRLINRIKLDTHTPWEFSDNSYLPTTVATTDGYEVNFLTSASINTDITYYAYLRPYHFYEVDGDNNDLTTDMGYRYIGATDANQALPKGVTLTTGQNNQILASVDTTQNPDMSIALTTPAAANTQTVANDNADHITSVTLNHATIATGQARFIDINTGEVVGTQAITGRPNQDAEVGTLTPPLGYMIVSDQTLPTSVHFYGHDMGSCDVLVNKNSSKIIFDHQMYGDVPINPDIQAKITEPLTKTLTRTINIYASSSDATPVKVVKQTVDFSRTASYDPTTDKVTYNPWMAIGTDVWNSYHAQWKDGYAIDSVTTQQVTGEMTDTTASIYYRPISRTITIRYVDETGKEISHTTVTNNSVDALQVDVHAKVPKDYDLAANQSIVMPPYSQHTIDVLVVPNEIVLTPLSDDSDFKKAGISQGNLTRTATRVITIINSKTGHQRNITQRLIFERNALVKNGQITYTSWKSTNGKTSFAAVFIPKMAHMQAKIISQSVSGKINSTVTPIVNNHVESQNVDLSQLDKLSPYWDITIRYDQI